MKKILIVTGIFPPDIGGPATYVSKIMEDLTKRGFEVEILTLGSYKNEKNVFYIPREYNFFKRSLLIKKFIEKKNYDIVFSQTPFSVGFGVALSKTKAKKVIKIVGDNVWEISCDILGVKDGINQFQKKFYGLKIWIMKKIQNYSAKKGNLIITPSNYLKNLVVEWGVSSKKIKVIYNAVKLESKDFESKSKLKKELKITQKTYITVARLTPWKGIEVLINLFKNKSENLIIIGDGPKYKEYLKITQGLKNIKMLGRLDNTNVKKYIRASDYFILNSGYEGLPHVVIEAFQMQTPVLISNVCGNPEIVKDGYNGVLFEYNNQASIEKAIERIEKMDVKKITKNAEKSLMKFDWDEMIQNLVEVLR